MEQDKTVKARVSGVPLRTLRLRVTRGPDAGATVTTQGATVTVGTAPGNDLVLTDETVSRYHLELERAGDRIMLLDHGSTNGTAIGVALVSRASIPAGTTLELGHTALLVEDGETVTVELHGSDSLGKLRGRSRVMRRLMARIERAAESEASVLLLGETGTGKEIIAQAIHAGSRRSTKPIETVDCGALMPTLIASELFGHEAGAFTGADRQHLGAFERADGGTIFLDEIGELPAALQASLLGVLERRRFKRVGGLKEIAVDVRVIAATHRDLRAEVNAGTFRQDLYFRLAVVLLSIPPLRERADDIPLLLQHFLREAGYAGQLDELIPPRAMEQLMVHHWPGNVRELRNLAEATLALGEPAPVDSRGTHAVPTTTPGVAASTSSSAAFTSVPVEELMRKTYKEARDHVLTHFETMYLRSLLARAHDNVSLAAREADMNRSYLIEMLKRHGLR